MPEFATIRNPSRRDVVALGIGALIVAGIPMARRRPHVVRRALPMMGTVGEVVVLHRDERFASRAIDAAFRELRRIEALMTRFDPNSDVGRVNGAPDQWVGIASETRFVLEAALHHAQASRGRFDPCLGKVTEVWDVAHRHEPPPAEQFARLAGRSLFRALEIGDGRDPCARLLDADAHVDLGGIAKGYGVDRAALILRHWGIQHGLVNVGGDLFAIGRSSDGDPWRVGIRSPADPSSLLGHLDVEDGAVATSGDYLRFFAHRGRRYHHLLDPMTGSPIATSMRSTTVAAPTCMEADAVATGVYGLAEPEAAALGALMAPTARLIRQI